MSEPTLAELRIRAVEIAEKTVHQPYLYRSESNVDQYCDKDIGEVLSRARKIMRYVMEEESEESEKSLIEKLRATLCNKE